MRSVELFLMEELRAQLSSEFLSVFDLRVTVQGENEDFSEYVLCSTLSSETMIPLGGCFREVVELRLFQRVASGEELLASRLSELQAGVYAMIEAVSARLSPSRTIELSDGELALLTLNSAWVTAADSELYAASIQLNTIFQIISN